MRLTYAFQLCFGLLVWVPVFYSYQRMVGLSDEQILGIQSIYYIAFCLFEIPTGLVADRFDYRWSLAGGAGVLVVANLLPIAEPTYLGFLTHWLLIALARSLVSGAASAYLYEYLSRAGETDFYQQAEGNSRAYSLIGKLVCWPAAGALMQWHMSSVYWLTACNAALALLAALALPRLPARPGTPNPPHPAPGLLPRQRSPHSSVILARFSWLESLHGACRQLRHSRFLVLIMLQGVAIFTLVRIGQVNLFQPILESKHMPVVWHGTVMAAMTLCEVAGASRSHWIRRLLGDIRAVFVATAVMAVSLALIAPAGVALTMACLCVFALVAGLSYPVQRGLLNSAITDARYRATVLSIESILDRGVCALTALALGAYLARGDLEDFLVHSALGAGIVMAVLIPLFILAHRRQPGAH